MTVTTPMQARLIGEAWELFDHIAYRLWLADEWDEYADRPGYEERLGIALDKAAARARRRGPRTKPQNLGPWFDHSGRRREALR